MVNAQDGNDTEDARAQARARIDHHVGNRLRYRRVLLGLTQEGLAALLDVTFQQIQKYERGANRISASRLYELSTALGVPVEFFFEALPDAPGTAFRRPETRRAPATRETSRDAWPEREIMDLVRAYTEIRDVPTRRAICSLVQTIGSRAASLSE